MYLFLSGQRKENKRMDSFSRRVYVISHNSCPSTASGEPVSFVADMQSKWRSRIVGTSAVRIGGESSSDVFY